MYCTDLHTYVHKKANCISAQQKILAAPKSQLIYPEYDSFVLWEKLQLDNFFSRSTDLSHGAPFQKKIFRKVLTPLCTITSMAEQP